MVAGGERSGAGAAARMLLMMPGLVLLALLATAAIAAREAGLLWVFSPIVVAILAGLAIGNLVTVPRILEPGIRSGSRTLLRVAIILLGFQLTFTEVAATGVAGVASAILAVAVTLPAVAWLGARMGVRQPLALLIATGTAICGASAIVAANDVVRGRDDDVAYALAIITLFGTLAIFLWPPLGLLLGFDELTFGRWAGASIHEVGQVVAAGFQYGPAAGETATTVKLVRVLLLAPALIGLAVAMRRTRTAAERRVPLVPPYVAGFLLCVALNSLAVLPAFVGDVARWAVPVLFCMALGGIGLQTRFGALRRHGIRPIALGAAATLGLAAMSAVFVAAATALGL